ncbi:hypothetical protein ACLMJK_002603 [Lecanora helva]
MPTSGLDYDKHGRPARVKPRKDQDNRSIASSSSSRRHRDSSVSSSRASLPQECPAQRPASTSSNVHSEQLPSLSESDPGSPSSLSSPMLRSSSTISKSTLIASPTIPHTPASLQQYLEPESDSPDVVDAQATPKAEKPKDQCDFKDDLSKATEPKAESSKAEEPTSQAIPSNTAIPIDISQESSESKKTNVTLPSTRPEHPIPSIQETQYKDIHQPAPKHPLPPNLTFAPDQSNPGPTYTYSNVPPMQQTFQSPQLAYLPLPQQADPMITQQAVAAQGILYYPEYGPPPVPDPPNQMQYPPAPMERSRDEDPLALLNRVHYTMPDLHALLDSYHEMIGIVDSREAQIRGMEAQRATEKQHQDKRLAKLEMEIESLLKIHSTESSRLKSDVSNLEKKCKMLQNKLITEEKSTARLQTTNEELRAEKRLASKKYEEERVAMIQKQSHEKDRMAADHRGKQKASHDELQAQTRKAEASLSHMEAHLIRAHEEEKHKAELGWTKQRREIEDRYTRLQTSLEDKIEAKQKVIDEERRTYLHAREGWDHEREVMLRRWDEEREFSRKSEEEHIRTLTLKHEREKNDILRQVSHTQQQAEKEESIIKLQRDLETVRSEWEKDKYRFQRTTAEFRSTAKTLNEQNSKLQKLSEALGDVQEVKGK